MKSTLKVERMGETIMPWYGWSLKYIVNNENHRKVSLVFPESQTTVHVKIGCWVGR